MGKTEKWHEKSLGREFCKKIKKLRSRQEIPPEIKRL
jgi:hypothetical protein